MARRANAKKFRVSVVKFRVSAVRTVRIVPICVILARKTVRSEGPGSFWPYVGPYGTLTGSCRLRNRHGGRATPAVDPYGGRGTLTG